MIAWPAYDPRVATRSDEARQQKNETNPRTTMALTPADIHNTAFKKPPIGKRGYDEEEVDAFLDEVEQELIRLLEENGALHDQMRRGGGGGAALSSELAELMAQL